MNKNLLKWILIAAVIVGAAGFLMLSETSSKKEKIVVGHSKPFKIEPFEGITISAPKNALDKDRKFKFSPVTEKQWKKDAKVVQEHFGVEPFLVMDLDAGMDPNELLPGKYTVQMDLKKMGVPKNLWRHVNAYRIAHGGKKGDCYEYNSRVSANGILSFESNQNSGVALAVVFGEVAWQSFGYTLFLLLGKAGHDAYVMADVKSYFKDPKDVMVVPMEDPNGNFNVYFRWKDTSRGLDGRKAFEENEDKAMTRLDELKKEAEEEYERRINKMATGKESLAWWEKIANKGARDAAMKTLALDSVLKEKIGKDSLLRKLNADPASRLPVEVDMNIQQILKANDYLKNAAKVEPLTYSIAIYLMSNTTMGSTSGLNTTPYIGHCYIKVNMDSGMKQGKWMNTPAFSQSALLTLIHEGFHARQQSNYCHIAPMRMLPSEATAPVLEQDAARYLYKHGRIITVDPDSEEGSSIEFTGRDKHLLHAIPLDKISPKIDGMDPESGASASYTLADLIEIVRETSGKKDVGMVRFCEEYARNRKFSVLIKKALGIDDATFEKGWEAFVKSKLGTIVSSQQTAEMQKNKDFKECWQTNYTFSDSNPFMKIKVEKDKYYVRSWFFYFSSADETKPSIFIRPAKGSQFNPQIHFYLKNEAFVDGKETPCVYMKELPHLMAMDVANLDLSNKKEVLEYEVVAFFPPEKLKIRKAKEDQITFIVPKAPRALTKEKLITGAVVTYKDNKGNVVTRDIQAKDFGRKATWSIVGCTKPGNGFSLSMHWYYRVDEQTVYESPESEPVTWGSKGDQPEEETRPIQEPKTNYWKQVGGRMKTENTSIDKGESIDDEEVSSDYRSIELQAAQTGRSFDFTGMGATEERTKENGHVYVKDIFIEGTLTYTEPPKFWIPAQQYKARWEIADDPYLTKVKDPFVFEAKNASSNQAACAQSKKDKVDNGHSTTGKANWLRAQSTTFEARFPEKDGPKSFTLTQTYSIKEREGSNLMATVTFEYYYEWIGEPEEEVMEEETAPEGGHWKLVKTETDDSHRHFQAEDIYGDKNKTTATINGGSGSYSMHVDWWGAITNGKQFTGKNGFIYKINRQFHGGTPKQYYTPGKNFNLSWVSEELQAESLVEEMPFNAKSFDHYPNGSLSLLGYDAYLLRKNNNRIACDAKHTPDRMEMNLGVVPEKEAYPKGFVICETVVLDYPSAAAPGCYINNYYIYEWVEGEPEEETAPEGGYWQLVKTDVDDAHMTFTDQNGSKYVISGGAGQYHLHMDIAGEIYEKGSDGYYHEVGKGVIHTIDRDYAFETPKQYYREKETGPAMSESEETTTEITNGAGHNSTPYIWGSGGFRLEKLDFETTFPKKLYSINHYEYDMRKKGHEWRSNFSIPDHDMFYPDGFKIIQRVIISENCYFQKVYTYEWVDGK